MTTEIKEIKTLTCEVCPNSGPEYYRDEQDQRVNNFKVYKTMLMCIDCYDKEIALTAANETPLAQQSRVELHNELTKLQQIQQVDNSIQIVSDIFNAQTASILELKQVIVEDASVPADKKDFRLAQELGTRIAHLQKTIFEENVKQVERANAQRALQTYLNNMQSVLRAEERAELQLQNINYKPAPVKVSKPKTVSNKKYDTSGIKNAAIRLEEHIAKMNHAPVPSVEAMVRMSCVSKNLTPDEALEVLKALFVYKPKA